jgi:3-demethoxyubiquinol 3-hydroxylase
MSGENLDSRPRVTVLFDGSCPLCRREIALYQRVSVGDAVHWQDVCNAQMPLPPGLDRTSAMARFHVVEHRSDRSITHSGAKAFTALWQHIPGWRWLGLIGTLPIVSHALELTYRAFLVIQPQMQAIARRAEPAESKVPQFMVRDLRSDQAGETGAVWIYKGILLLARDTQLRAFASHHLETEEKHLLLMNNLLSWRQRSRLLGFWKIAGFLTGAIPALIGTHWVYATIQAVETFVDHHYAQQIDKLENTQHIELKNLLISCQKDECLHRDEAGLLSQPKPGLMLRLWCKLVSVGSAQAVGLAKLI